MAAPVKKSNYAAVLRKAMKSTSQRLDKALQATAIEGITRMINLTPVDTGAAKYHWFIRVQPTENFNKEAVDGSGALPIARAKRDVKLFRTTMVLFLVNSAPYFKYLEDGSSTQAPNGVVGITRASMHLIWDAAIKVAFSKDARTAKRGVDTFIGP
jgi:hypothetical protein